MARSGEHGDRDTQRSVIAGPVREREETLIAELDLGLVAASRRFIEPAGHYNRPDVFRLLVDTAPRPPVEIVGPALAQVSR